MIYVIRVIRPGDDPNEVPGLILGSDGWKEPIPPCIGSCYFATEDINKAYQWCEKWQREHPHCKYEVEELKKEYHNDYH